jgi:FtsH-binding integral membrane protein
VVVHAALGAARDRAAWLGAGAGGSATGHGSARGALVSAGVALVVLAAVAAGWTLERDAFLASAHLVAAVVFFGLVAAVAVVNAVAPPSRPGVPAAPWLRRSYGVLAVALVIDLAVTVVAVLTGHADDMSPPPLFVGEAVALALFVVFWVLQSVQRWDDPDPAVRGSTPPRPQARVQR